ncbi:MAG: FlgD immunoglobulin-like domain containing protein, partial [Candidatus Eisenbacteria bacterium]
AVPDNVTLTLYDMQGHIVRTLKAADPTERGSHRVAWDLRYRTGMLAPPGTYFCALRAGGEMTVRKLVILR